ncbi:MAG TPA: thioredoxin family protein [Ohtaekwangia sp.]|uniref:thioredoxin family protein n=1 Tax=Ohtaekwangia sp. TaxID=2066019 RepID=UPI002F933ECD
MKLTRFGATRNIVKYSIIFLIGVSAVTATAQVQQQADEAFRIASEMKRPVLLVFAGSDWCAPCIRFEKKILQEKAFQDFASENLVILEADFPQRKKLADEIKQQNERLADRYNPSGQFPYLVLLRVDRSVLSPLHYTNETPLEFIDKIKHHLLP